MAAMPLQADCVVETLAQVLTGERPVMVVEHWATEGWVFRPSGSYYAADMVEVPFAELLRVDESLAALADLPSDWIASRRTVGEAWRRRWIYEDTWHLWESGSDKRGVEPDAAERRDD